MKKVVWGLVLFLAIIHQDFWFWDNPTLLFGFMPISLAYHAGISIAAAITWYMATIYCWPADIDESAPAESEGAQA